MPTAQQTIHELEDKLKAATLQNDVVVTDELLADDWLNINANGSITRKEQSLALMPDFQFLSIENSDVEIRVYPNLAIVTGRSTRQLQGADDTVFTSHVLFTRVYAQINGRWQVVTSQATPIL